MLFFSISRGRDLWILITSVRPVDLTRIPSSRRREWNIYKVTWLDAQWRLTSDRCGVRLHELSVILLIFMSWAFPMKKCCSLRERERERVSSGSDLVCVWFLSSRLHILQNVCCTVFHYFSTFTRFSRHFVSLWLAAEWKGLSFFDLSWMLFCCYIVSHSNLYSRVSELHLSDRYIIIQWNIRHFSLYCVCVYYCKESCKSLMTCEFGLWNWVAFYPL